MFGVNHVKSLYYQNYCGENSLSLDWIEPCNELAVSKDESYILLRV